MGFWSSRCENFTLYEIIKNIIINRLNDSDSQFNDYLISSNSIPNFINLLKENDILKQFENKNIKDLEDKLNDKLKKYNIEKNLIIYSTFDQCKNFIENKDENFKNENEFIIVDEKFLKRMKIEFETNKKVKIIIDKNKNMKIKFSDFEQEILFKKKDNGFYMFLNNQDNIKGNNLNESKNSSKFSIKFNYINLDSVKNGLNSQINSYFSSLKNHPLIYLKNIENTNNINIQLHCLANIPDLTIYFLQKKNNNDKNKFSEAFSDIIYNIWKKQDRSNIYSPLDLKNLIGEDSNLFLPKNFIPFLFEKIHNELNEKNKEDNNDNIIESDETFAETEYYNFLENFNKKNKSIITQMFSFEQLFKNKCKFCNMETFNFSMVNNLIFNLNEVLSNNKRENINLFDCFDYYTKINSIICQKCNNLKE